MEYPFPIGTAPTLPFSAFHVSPSRVLSSSSSSSAHLSVEAVSPSSTDPASSSLVSTSLTLTTSSIPGVESGDLSLHAMQIALSRLIHPGEWMPARPSTTMSGSGSASQCHLLSTGFHHFRLATPSCVIQIDDAHTCRCGTSLTTPSTFCSIPLGHHCIWKGDIKIEEHR